MKWTEEKKDKLIELFANNSNKKLADFFNTTIASIAGKARTLKLIKDENYKVWTKEKTKKLIKLYSNNSNKKIAQIFNTSINSVNGKARIMKLNKDNNYKSNSIRKGARFLSYDIVKKIAKKYKTRHEFSLLDKSAYSYAIKKGFLNDICSHMIPQNISMPELILKYIILKIFNEEILYNTRKIIKPYELDIYIPKYNLAFEYDGLYWHKNRIIDNIKNNLCDEKNIKLIRINDYNISSSNYINDIKKIIENRLDEINNYCKTNIQKEEIIFLSNEEIQKFINNNILDYDQIREITNKYDNYSNFKKNQKSLCRKLLKMKISHEFTSHMHRDVVKWNIELCKNEISKYESFIEFRKKSVNCYNYILKYNLDNLLSHYTYKSRRKK